jgi:phosphoribosylanthranilate isomerase
MLKNTSNKVFVKICGITNLEDAQAAVKFGADAVGFVFAKSPRQVTAKEVCKLSQAIGPFVSCVGVFVDQPIKEVLRAMETAQLDVVQLHGAETPADCKRCLPYRIIKVFRVGNRFSQAELDRYSVDAHMLETDARVAGGSGQIWNWESQAHTAFKKPMIVTGGLNPENVQRAIRILRPYAVDVSSGVEKRPGVKDHKLMEQFIHHAKTA